MSTWALAAYPQYGWTEGMLSLQSALGQFEGVGDANIAAALNALRRPTRVAVPTSRVLSILLKTGDWGRLVLLSRGLPTGGAEDALIAAAIVAVTAVERTTEFGTERDEDAAVVETMITSFQQAGIFQQETADRLLGLMHVEEPIWNPPVTAADVTLARDLTDG